MVYGWILGSIGLPFISLFSLALASPTTTPALSLSEPPFCFDAQANCQAVASTLGDLRASTETLREWLLPTEDDGKSILTHIIFMALYYIRRNPNKISDSTSVNDQSLREYRLSLEPESDQRFYKLVDGLVAQFPVFFLPINFAWPEAEHQIIAALESFIQNSHGQIPGFTSFLKVYLLDFVEGDPNWVSRMLDFTNALDDEVREDVETRFLGSKALAFQWISQFSRLRQFGQSLYDDRLNLRQLPEGPAQEIDFLQGYQEELASTEYLQTRSDILDTQDQFETASEDFDWQEVGDTSLESIVNAYSYSNEASGRAEIEALGSNGAVADNVDLESGSIFATLEPPKPLNRYETVDEHFFLPHFKFAHLEFLQPSETIERTAESLNEAECIDKRESINLSGPKPMNLAEKEDERVDNLFVGKASRDLRYPNNENDINGPHHVIPEIIEADITSASRGRLQNVMLCIVSILVGFMGWM